MSLAYDAPVFETFFRRRSKRFPLGAEIKTGPFKYKSEKSPVPLNKLETAMLCFVGAGINGLILDEQRRWKAALYYTGRTISTPCSSHTCHLFFLNDGVFYYDIRKIPTFREHVRIATLEDRTKILEDYRKAIVKLPLKREDLMPDASLLRDNRWFMNKPGTTVFIPVVDFTAEYINFMFTQLNKVFWDEEKDQPAGVKKWIDKGLLRGPKVPISLIETLLNDVIVFEAAMCVQNILLAATAMGLGGVCVGGYTPLIVMGGTPLAKGLGFRFKETKTGVLNPVGIPDTLEGFIPPFMDVDVAVDKVVETKFGAEGSYTIDRKVGPYMKTLEKFSDDAIECVKDYFKYLLKTYGRYPKYYDSFKIPSAAQIHHIDIDFYDKYFPKECITEAERAHMMVWHPETIEK